MDSSAPGFICTGIHLRKDSSAPGFICTWIICTWIHQHMDSSVLMDGWIALLLNPMAE
jgi:hypothetical protein